MRRAFVMLKFAVAMAWSIAVHAGDFVGLAQRCAPQVDPHTLAAIVSVESAYNPYAIGVVGGRLVRQPASLAQALATIDMLERRGYNFSLGLAQVNRYNLARFNETTESIFEPCTNLRVAASILGECFARATHEGGDEQFALRKAISCFYSGNFSTGFTAGYVERVVSHALDDVHHDVAPIPLAPGSNPTPVSSGAGGAGNKGVHAARGVGLPARAPHVSRCAPGIVVLSDCENDGLPHGGTVKIMH